MKNSRHQTPEINTGSMADIAFLLLLFFLVATKITTDVGINRTLPKPCPQNTDCTKPTSENNILYISINSKNELFVKDKIIALEELKEITKSFLDNNASGTCDYCHGISSKSLSDHPSKAVVSLKNENGTSYDFYIAVQDKLTQAYYELRNNYALSVLGKKEEQLTESDINTLKKVYPFILSEVE